MTGLPTVPFVWELAREEGGRRMWMLPEEWDPLSYWSLTRHACGLWMLVAIPLADGPIAIASGALEETLRRLELPPPPVLDAAAVST